MLRSPLTALSLCILITGITGCDQRQAPQPEASAPAPAGFSTAAVSSASQNAWQLSRQQLQQTHECARLLQASIQSLVAAADEKSLEHARGQWHQCHNLLMGAMPLLTLGAVSPELWRPLRLASNQLEAWPIEPGYLDYFDVYSHSGIVNDIAIPVNAQSLRQQHGLTSDTDVSLGMHAMAYMLWGEQGQRPATDFATQPLTEEQRLNGLQPVDLPNRRRATVLQLQATLLVDDLQQLLNRVEQGDLDSLYQKLPAMSSLALWRESVTDLLTALSQPVQATTALSQPVQASEEMQRHNHFAGHQEQAEAALLKGIERLLFSYDDGQQPLAYWLVDDEQRTAEQLTELQQSLTQASARLQAGETEQQALQTSLQLLLAALSSGLQASDAQATDLSGL